MQGGPPKVAPCEPRHHPLARGLADLSVCINREGCDVGGWSRSLARSGGVGRRQSTVRSRIPKKRASSHQRAKLCGRQNRIAPRSLPGPQILPNSRRKQLAEKYFRAAQGSFSARPIPRMSQAKHWRVRLGRAWFWASTNPAVFDSNHGLVRPGSTPSKWGQPPRRPPLTTPVPPAIHAPPPPHTPPPRRHAARFRRHDGTTDQGASRLEPTPIRQASAQLSPRKGDVVQ